jgi:cation diffusion facilitator CzcD-associated flavoprotein CzcO
MPSDSQTDVLIIGAGPFGLSLASRLRHQGVEHRIVGETMGFWRQNMPTGMFLRSSWDWHLDPQHELTIERFMAKRGISREQVSPFPIGTYLDYVDWFRQESKIAPEPLDVLRLDRERDESFTAHLRESEPIRARRVVLALGFSSFAHVPEEVMSRVPAAMVRHTRDFVDFDEARGKSVLIVGGRQSAFEWAALLVEAGAARIDICHRHPSPAFAEADWSWVPPLMDLMIAEPAWFRSLPAEEQREYGRRLWSEGRLKVEPWLEPRIRSGPVTIRPETEILACRPGETSAEVALSDGTALEVDLVIAATGYKPDIGRIDLVQRGNLAGEIDVADGVPALDERFQTSVPGLFATSLLASRQFGPFFGFTVAARGAATVLGDYLAQ